MKKKDGAITQNQTRFTYSEQDAAVRILKSTVTWGRCVQIPLKLRGDDAVGHVHYLKVVDLQDPEGSFAVSQAFLIKEKAVRGKRKKGSL